MWQPEQPSSQTVASVFSSLIPGSPSRMMRRYGRNSGCLRTFVPARLFSNSAPVGHTCTHLPQLVQVSDSPHGSFRSVITRHSEPRPITPHVFAPSISEHTRTHRVHSTHRL